MNKVDTLNITWEANLSLLRQLSTLHSIFCLLKCLSLLLLLSNCICIATRCRKKYNLERNRRRTTAFDYKKYINK